MRNRRFALMSVVGAGLMTVVAACATQGTAGPDRDGPEAVSAAAAPHNMADVAFTQLMIIHHQSVAGVELAKSILATQQSEIAEMQTLLSTLK